MRVPLPNDRIVALTLVGAVLTAGVAVGLANPSILGAGGSGGDDDQAQQVGPDAPTPNAEFTPAVQSSEGEDYGGDENGAGEEERDEEESEDEREGGDGEYEEGDEGDEE